MVNQKRIVQLSLLLLVTAIYLSCSSGNVFKDAFSVWHFRNNLEENRFYLLDSCNPGCIGNKLSDNEFEASISEGGDGYYASFNGSRWLSFYEKEPLFEKDEGTVVIRFFPEKPGGILFTDRLSIVLHGSGILIVVVCIRDTIGTMYREIPFSFIDFNKWHNLVLRYQSESVELILDGVIQGKAELGGSLESDNSSTAFFGKWRLDKMPLPGFPENVVDNLSQRIFTGKIDHIAIWKRSLKDSEVEMFFTAREIKSPDPIPDYQKCIEAYRSFHAASRKKDVNETTNLGLSMRKYMALDRKRPVYHLTAPMDAIFDPAGAFYFKGKYHVFSYRNMVSLLAATPLSHYVSDDLIHWQDYPIGVWADSEFDKYGIWLGNIFIDDNGVPNMLYTALGSSGKSGVLAQSYDNLLSFTNKKAVITGLVHHDGHVWKEDKLWYSLTTEQHWGRREGEKGDAVLLLSSHNLTEWTNCGEIFFAPKYQEPSDTRQEQGFAEFPYLLQFGDKHVLMIGTAPSKYWIGRFDKSIPSFIPDHKEGKLIDHLNTFHCFNPSTTDSKGTGGSIRRIIQAMDPHASGNVNSVPWYGVHTLPRVLSFDGKRLLQEPVSEVEQLRYNYKLIENIKVSPGVISHNTGLYGDAVEIIAEFEPINNGKFGLLIHTDNKGEDGIRIYYDTSTGRVGVDGNIKKPVIYPELGETSAYLSSGENIRFRIFIDHSLFEVFVNGETFTGVYNGDQENSGIYLFSDQGDAVLKKLESWQMKPAWPLELD
jgi:beta-fructofuranosidase